MTTKHTDTESRISEGGEGVRPGAPAATLNPSSPGILQDKEARFQASPEAPDGFPFGEAHVRTRLGIRDKDEMRALRTQHLKTGEWTRGKKGRVFLSAAAVERLAALAGTDASQLKNRAPGPKADAAGPVKKERELIMLRVVRTQVTNPRLVLMCPEQEDPRKPRTILRMRIRAGLIFRVGDLVPARPISGYTDFYDFAGRIRRGTNVPDLTPRSTNAQHEPRDDAEPGEGPERTPPPEGSGSERTTGDPLATQ